MKIPLSRLSPAFFALLQRRRSLALVAFKGLIAPLVGLYKQMIYFLCSRDGLPGIKANLKAVQGDLFMLEKYIFFVSKQPSLVELSDIHQVIFSRVGSSMGATAARTFDLKIVTKSGLELTFTSINKEEHEPTEAYLKEKKIRIKNEMVPDADLLLAAAAGDDDDDEMASVQSSDRDVPQIRAGVDDEDSEEGIYSRLQLPLDGSLFLVR